MHRDDSSQSSDPLHAMVGGPQPPGDALVVQSNGAPHALAIPTPTPVTNQDVLRGGMDANTLMHALRRRWLLASCVGLVLAILTAALLWYNFPESSSATAIFRVSNQQDNIFSDINRLSPQGYEILKKSQLSVLRQWFVLNAAVRKPGIASLSALAGEIPEEWLMERLEVSYPQQGEYLTISLSGSEAPEDLKLLVNAVADAYADEVVFKDRSRKAGNKDTLNKVLADLNKKINDKSAEYIAIAKESERPQASTRVAGTEILLNEIGALQKKKSEYESRLIQMQTDYTILKSRLTSPNMLDMKVEEKLATDYVYQSLLQRLNMAQYSLSQATSSGRQARAAAGAQRNVADTQNQVASYKAQVRRQMEFEQQNQPNTLLQQYTKEYQTASATLRMQYAGVTNTLKLAMEALVKRTAKSVDLDAMGNEIEQMQQIADDMSVKAQSMAIEANAPAQIELIQRAVSSGGSSKTQQVTISSIGGITAFALGCVLVGYLEFRGRRLNGPDEVNEGLGIRVIGTLPSLSSRHALDPLHPIVAQLTESIDGVRTILMHDSTSKRRQVVLVTSAATMEGRTTVASQLAASLARAGRRTLLVDGDLRRPALHALFDVPLEDGLCEVLRAEVDVDDVIRPTHAEGLWLLTAGYCDIDAIHALATEQMQPVFDKLRTEYDFVIIDGAPVVGMSDALIFGQYSDGAILSVRRDHSQMPKINQAAELLRDVGIRIIGAVVNGVPAKADDRIVQLRLIAPKGERELQPTG
jgi:capsular exopolysaccharide synthesis family protein